MHMIKHFHLSIYAHIYYHRKFQNICRLLLSIYFITKLDLCYDIKNYSPSPFVIALLCKTWSKLGASLDLLVPEPSSDPKY